MHDEKQILFSVIGKVQELLQNSGFHKVWLYPESFKINTFTPYLEIDLGIYTLHNGMEYRNMYLTVLIHKNKRMI